ncbi:MAG: hypothetical protein SFV21_08755 [Rhodospirillaceae bacterium]|nr:hypothetical protein [Rhodospirillaceae bacterium]
MRSFLALALAAALTTTDGVRAQNVTEPAPTIGGANANVVRGAKGTVVYKVLSTGAMLGGENWNLTVHPDGSRTMQALNRYGSPGVQRHVTLRVDARFRPLEAYLLYWVGGVWRGSGYFTVAGDTLTAVANTPNGRLSHALTVPENFSFIPHPLSTDAWHMWYYDKAKGGAQTITVYDMPGGADGPQALLGSMYTQSLTFVGRERVTTPAGTFDTEHYKIDDAVDIYVTGPDAIMVKFVWTPADRVYELVKLEPPPQ